MIVTVVVVVLVVVVVAERECIEGAGGKMTMQSPKLFGWTRGIDSLPAGGLVDSKGKR